MWIREFVQSLRDINLGTREPQDLKCVVHAANATADSDGSVLIVLDITVGGDGEPLTAWWRTREQDHNEIMWDPTKLAGLVSLMLDESIGTGRIRHTEHRTLKDSRWWLPLA